MVSRVPYSLLSRARGLSPGSGPGFGALPAWLLAICLAAAVPPAASARNLEITVGGTALRGIMLVPPGTRPFTAVLIVPGSGPTDKDGNQPHLNNDSLKLLAEGLLKRNIGSLRFDKRGVGRSSADSVKESDLRFETYIDDTAAWAKALARQPRVASVYLLGHSEGSLIAIMAAQKVEAAGVISVAGSCVPANELMKSQVGKSQLPASLRHEADRVIDTLAGGKTVAEVSPGLTVLFRPSVQPYLISWFRYNPRTEIGRLKIPVLVLHGLNDREVSPRHARPLYRSCTGCSLRLIKGMNHVLKQVDGSVIDDIKSYNELLRPVSPELIRAIAGFVKGPRPDHARSARRGNQGHRRPSPAAP